MKKNKSIYLFIIIIILITILNINISFSKEVKINIDEKSNLKELNNGDYSLKADGILTFYNPSNKSYVYDFELPLKLDSLIGINKVPLKDKTIKYTTFDNSTNTTINHTKTIKKHSNKFIFDFNKIYGHIIEPNQTISVGYHIYGLLNYNIYNKLNDSQPILDYYIDKYNFRTKLTLNLQKPQREGFEYNLSGDINKTPSDFNNTRLISAKLRNPTDFTCNLKSIKIYRTNTHNSSINNGVIIEEKNNLELPAFNNKLLDFFDYQSSVNSVYWLSADSIIYNNLNFSTQKKINKYTPPTSSKSSSSKRSSGGGLSYFNNKTLNSILVKKETDKTVIRNNEKFQVIIRIVNVEEKDLNNLILIDKIPENYEIQNVSESVKLQDRTLTFNIDSINKYKTKVLKYTLIAKKKDYKGITFLKPAHLIYDNEDYYSEGIILINDLLPEEKIFVQKKISYINDMFAQVNIIVKNLGSYEVKDLLISDTISQNSTIKDISKIFYKDKGSWNIKNLKAGEEWKVSYMISRDSNLDTLPNVFGIEKDKIYSTLISSEEIISNYKQEPQTIEKIGMGLAVGFLILYLLF